MKTLFPEDDVKNPLIDQPWMKSETDKMLDMYFNGTHPQRIAAALGRNPKAVKRRIEKFTYNECDRAVKYEPFRRLSRRGKRLTENEKLMIQVFRNKRFPMEALARVLCRELKEIHSDLEGQITRQRFKEIAPRIDLLLAYRYQYWVSKTPLIADSLYDEMKQEEMEFGGGADILSLPASDRVTDYPPYIRSLALYLEFKLKKERKNE